MLTVGNFRSEYDNYICFKVFDNCTYIYFLLYVIDMLIVTKLNKLKFELLKEFDMKDLGEIIKILGVNI